MAREKSMTIEPGQPSVASIVAARLSFGAGQRGFGNARAVRNQLEQAIKRQEERLSLLLDAMSEPTPEEAAFISRDDALGAKPVLDGSPELKQLNELEGLEDVKQKVQELMHLQLGNWEREERGEKPLYVPLHRIFYGNPGTGKTTVAKIFGRILKRFGFLSNGEVVTKGPADFLGSAVGESERKTVELLDACKGKVLLIDECYALNPKRTSNSFAANVIDTLVQKVQGTPGEDIAILLAGYEEEVNALLRDANPGLSRRFRAEDAFRFEDYTDEQLVTILREKVRNAGLSITLPTAEDAVKVISRERMKPNFGNAGAVDNALTRAKERMQSRLTRTLAAERAEAERGMALPTGGTKVNQSLLTVEDFDKSPADFGRARAALDDLVDVGFIYDYLDELEASLEIAKEEERDPRDMLGHLAFCGTPGVGKATIASRFGAILKQVGLLASDNVVKMSGRTMQDRYLGGTQAKVTEIVKSALGGVLFIDDAGGMSPDERGGGGGSTYNKEVCETLSQLILSDAYRGKLVVLVAGTSEDIGRLFASSPVLASCFTKTIMFPSWGPAMAAKVLLKKVEEKKIELSAEALAALEPGLSKLMRSMGAAWACGRTINALEKAMYNKRGKRIFAQRKAGETPAPKTYEFDDFKVSLKELSAASGSEAFDNDDDELLDALQRHIESWPTPATPLPGGRDAGGAGGADGAGGACSAGGVQSGVPPTWGARGAVPLLSGWASGVGLDEWQHDICGDADDDEELYEEPRIQEVPPMELEPEFEMAPPQAKLKANLSHAMDAAPRGRKARDEAKEEEEEEEPDEETRILEALKEMGPCPAGYSWFKRDGGWCCAGGTHFVKDDDPILNKKK